MITDLETYPLLLLKGGRPTISSGNRCRELAEHLEPFELDGTGCFEADTVIERMKELCELGVNIGGSRGYVYFTPHLLDLTTRLKVGKPFQWNLFPRAGGLREALMNHFEADTSAGWL